MATKSVSRAATLIIAILFAHCSLAQSTNTEHTLRLDDGASSPVATLADVDWLTGSWHGEAFGDKFEEVWNSPSAGTMVGMFKLLDGDSVAFYELLLLVEENESIAMKVKHFNADFSAWEEKADYVTFRLVAIEENAIHFSGLSFHRISDDEIVGYLALKNGDEIYEEKLTYVRAN